MQTKNVIVQTAMETLEPLRERVTNRSLGKGRTSSITANIDAALQSLDRCRTEIDRGRNKQANNVMTAAMNQLGALINSISATNSGNGKGKNSKAKSKKDLDAAFRTSLVINHLADARDIAP